jgi:endonuclease/exonuclease/phosphatase family metal-dependent hydrolase
VLLTLSCAGAPSSARSRDADTLRVMTYNIFAGNDLERRSNLERIAALIDSLDVDVAFLQEVDRNTTRSGRVDQPAVLAGRAGRHVVFGRSMDYGGGEFGNAILSRWPVRSFRIVQLGQGLPEDTAAAAEPRTLLHAVIDVPGGAVHLVNTHLDHRANSPARHTQLLEVLAYVADSIPRAAAIVFGGDFNTRPETPAVRALALFFTDAWLACGTGSGYTFRSDNPDRRIDYLMLARAHCSRAWVPDITHSDHQPVIADVHIRR